MSHEKQSNFRGDSDDGGGLGGPNDEKFVAQMIERLHEWVVCRKDGLDEIVCFIFAGEFCKLDAGRLWLQRSRAPASRLRHGVSAATQCL